MRGIFAILVGAGFMAVGLDIVLIDEDMPLLLRWFVGAIGAILVLTGLFYIRFQIRRRIALSGGRERRGTLRLRQELKKDSTTAFLTFATSYGEWLLILDPEQVRACEPALLEGVKARATMGENDRIYAISFDGIEITLQNEGVPFEGKMRDWVNAAEERYARLEADHGKRERKPQSPNE